MVKRLSLLSIAVLAAAAGVLALIALLTGPGPVQAAPTATTYRYVAAGGSDTGECTADNPCRTIQYALAKANAEDTLIIAAGTYTGTVEVTKTVTLEGGYSRIWWSSGWMWLRLSCDPSTTVLDGLRAGRVVSISSGVAFTANCLTITGGDAAGLGGSASGDDAGGGLYAWNPTRVFLSNAVITDNIAGGTFDRSGGGVYVHGGPLVLSNTVVVSNSARYGCGVSLDNADSSVIQASQIISNGNCDRGGGLYVYESSVLLENTDVLSNTAAQGGGLYLGKADNSVIRTSRLTNNTGSSDGGGAIIGDSDGVLIVSSSFLTNSAIYGDGGGLFLSHSSSLTVRDCRFSGNQAGDRGGGIVVVGGTANSILSSTITLNDGDDGGGGLCLINSDYTLYNNFIVQNKSSFRTGRGRGILAYSGTLRMAHNTLAGALPGQYALEGIVLESGATAWLTNTILVGYPTGIQVNSGCTATLQATLWGTGTWANTRDWEGDGAILTGTINIWGDPDFVDPAISNPGTGDYHIGPDSAAIGWGVDAGVPLDLDGEARVGAPDLGADEFVTYTYLPLVRR